MKSRIAWLPSFALAAVAAAPFVGRAGHDAKSRRGSEPEGVVLEGRLRPGEVDRYGFRLRRGDVLTVSLHEKGAGEFHDPLLGVFAPSDRKKAAAQSDDDGPGFLPRLAVEADESGTWLVAVTGFGDGDFDGEGHVERLRYELVVASQGQRPELVEREGRKGNDSLDDADPLRLRRGVAILQGELAPGDVDVFELWVDPRDTLTASVFDAAGGEFHDSVLRLRDRKGRELAQSDDGGPGFLSNLGYGRKNRDGRPEKVFVELTGFDGDPEDERPHPEDFGYQLVISVGGAKR
jgi:hypothetical protein